MLILTVAVIICQDVFSRVGLVASDAERNSNVTVLRTYEAVKGAEFGRGFGHAFGQFCSLGTDSGRRFDTVFLEVPVPAAHFLPVLKAADLNVRNGVEAERSFRCLPVVIFPLGFF